MSFCPSYPSVKEYSNIFEYIQAYSREYSKNKSIKSNSNGHVHPSVRPSHPYTTSLSPCPSFMTTLIGPIVNAMPNRQPPMSSALLGLPRVPKALLFQRIGVGKLNMVAIRKLLRTSSLP
jgi:hypothetical protein